MTICFFGSMHGKKVDWERDQMKVPLPGRPKKNWFPTELYIKHSIWVGITHKDIYVVSTFDMKTMSSKHYAYIRELVNGEIVI